VLVVAVGTGPAAAASVGAAQGSASPAVLVCGEGAAVTRPASVILACADDGELAENLVWSSWTASQATATGTVTWKACATKCVDGKQWKNASAQVTLTDPVRQKGKGTLFTRLSLNVTGATPPGFQRKVTFSEAPLPAAVVSPRLAPRSLLRPALRAAPSGSLGYAQIEGFWIIAGGPNGSAGSYSQAQVAAAITGAESSFLPGIIQPGVDYCGGGADKAGWGLWQITCGNSVSQFGTDFQLLDPWNNAEAAVSKCKGDASAGLNCFDPWTTWLTGAYAQFLQHTAADTNLTDPGEYVQINSTPPGTPSSPAPDPGSTSGPPMPGGAPTAAYSGSVKYLLQEQAVTFNASASKPGTGGKIASYAWNFGDGTTASGAVVSHQFDTSAQVTVTVTVNDTDGKHSSASRSYFVLPSDNSASNYMVGTQNQEHMFYESSAGALEQDWWNTRQWSTQPLAGSPHADPVTLNWAGQEHVFDVGAGGVIEQDTWNGKAWVHQTLPGKAAPGSQLGGTDYITPGGVLEQHLFFAGSNGSLQQTWWNSKEWLNQNIPGTPAAGSPIVSSLYINGAGTLEQHVFFIGAGDTLQQTWWNAKTWSNQTLPGKPMAGQNALATSDFMNGSTLQVHVFLIGPGDTLQQTWWNGRTWTNQTLPGSPVLSGGLVTSDFSGQQHVFLTGSGNTLQQSTWNGASWVLQTLPGTAVRVLGTNDYATAGQQQHVFFEGNSGLLNQSWWNGKVWSTQALPGPSVAS
jgi:hypothetical protein